MSENDYDVGQQLFRNGVVRVNNFLSCVEIDSFNKEFFDHINFVNTRCEQSGDPDLAMGVNARNWYSFVNNFGSAHLISLWHFRFKVCDYIQRIALAYLASGRSGNLAKQAFEFIPNCHGFFRSTVRASGVVTYPVMPNTFGCVIFHSVTGYDTPGFCFENSVTGVREVILGTTGSAIIWDATKFIMRCQPKDFRHDFNIITCAPLWYLLDTQERTQTVRKAVINKRRASTHTAVPLQQQPLYTKTSKRYEELYLTVASVIDRSGIKETCWYSFAAETSDHDVRTRLENQ